MSHNSGQFKKGQKPHNYQGFNKLCEICLTSFAVKPSIAYKRFTCSKVCAALRYSKNHSGVNSVHYGKNHSEETKRKIRENRPPAEFTDEYKAKISFGVRKAIESGKRTYLRGSQHPNWKEDKKPKRDTSSIAYKEWRLAIFERDNFTCQMCGDDKGGNLEADHIKPVYLHPELEYETNNGRTLCKDCHKSTPTWGKKVYRLKTEMVL